MPTEPVPNSVKMRRLLIAMPVSLTVIALVINFWDAGETTAEARVEEPIKALGAGEVAVTPATSTCGATDKQTGRDASVIELAELRTAADPASAKAKMPIAGDLLDATIDESVPVRELCRSGVYSLVRILLPEELRKVQGWAPTKVLRAADTRANGSRIYDESYFEWLPEMTSHKALVVRAANKIAETDANCEAVDPVSPIGEPDQPGVFSLSCVGPRGSYPVLFTPTRIIGGKPPLADDVQPIAKADAHIPCVTAIEEKLSQPKTVDYHLSDRSYSTEGGRARYTIGFTANSGIGLPIDAMAECVFEGQTLTSATVIR